MARADGTDGLGRNTAPTPHFSRKAPAGRHGAPRRAFDRRLREAIASRNFASQSRVAFASMASNTGSNSPGKLLMTPAAPQTLQSAAPTTRSVHACALAPPRTAAHFRSQSPPGRRISSTNAICASVNGSHFAHAPVRTRTPTGTPDAEHRNSKNGSRGGDQLRDIRGRDISNFRIGPDVLNMDCFALKHQLGRRYCCDRLGAGDSRPSMLWNSSLKAQKLAARSDNACHRAMVD